MIGIGIRVTPQEIHYSLIKINEKETFDILSCNKLIIPKALDLPNKFTYIRTNIISIIEEYKVNHACIRITEPSAQRTSEIRLNLEGVIMELFANCKIEKYFTGVIASMASKLDLKSSGLKECIDGKNCFEIPSWEKYKANDREAIIAGIIAINL